MSPSLQSPRSLLYESKSPSPRRRSQRTRSAWCLSSLLLVAILCLLPSAALASQGDRSPEYNKCVDSCTADLCRDHVSDGTAEANPLPFILRVMRWTCVDDCKYHCTHRVTNEAAERVHRIQQEAQRTASELVNSGTISSSQASSKADELVQHQLSQLRPVQKQMVQYHGKWVFIRFLGAQEPLSVIFSLLNLRVHFKTLLMFRKELPDAFPLKLVYIIHTLISINAWFWSAVFHSRDKNFTEKMDYFSAGAVVLSAFFFSVCRLFRLAPGSRPFTLLKRACMGALALHILYLSIGRFDYAYNMTANVCVGLAHNALWLLYSLRPTSFPSNAIADRSAHSRAALRASKPPSALATPSNGVATPPVPVSTNIGPPSSSLKARRQVQYILALMTLAAMLELFDFPPFLRLLDAHALWHLSTVPVTAMWYSWLLEDAKDCVSTGWWLGDTVQFRWASDTLRGGAATLAQNIELHTLTNRLNELANKAGFSATASDREKEKAKELGERGLV